MSTSAEQTSPSSEVRKEVAVRLSFDSEKKPDKQRKKAAVLGQKKRKRWARPSASFISTTPRFKPTEPKTSPNSRPSSAPGSPGKTELQNSSERLPLSRCSLESFPPREQLYSPVIDRYTPIGDLTKAVFRSNSPRFKEFVSTTPAPTHYSPQPISQSVTLANAAFRAKSPRFKDKKSDVPPPGTYYNPDNSEFSATAKRSSSAPFGSAAPRFPEPKLPPTTPVVSVKTPQIHNPVPQVPSASFASSSPRFRTKPSTNPPPGTYDIPSTFTLPPHQLRPSAAFSGSSERFKDKPSTVPPPGQYDEIDYDFISTGPVRR